MSRRLGNLVASLLATAAGLLAAEGGVRLLWGDAPAAPGTADSLPVRQVRDPRVLYRLVPGSSGWYNGTRVSISSLGLRDREYAVPKPSGTARVLVLGDSMVFGVGVPPEETLPAHLGRRLGGVEAINAGVFGYNLVQQTSLLREIGPALRPDLVLACFVHNDVENWGVGDGGAVPEIRSSSFEPPPPGAWSTRLADLLLPDPFDPQRLNLLPSDRAAAGLRGRLSSWSRLYLFTYLRLRTHAWSLSGGERRDPLVGSPSCEAREVIWEPLRRQYRELRAAARQSGAPLAVVILGGWLWEGGPMERLHGILREEGIPFLDLTPVWLDGAFYASHYSLGWDPHPSAGANALAGGLAAEFIEGAGLLRSGPAAAVAGRAPGPHDVLDRHPDLRERLALWRARQAAARRSESAAWEARVLGLDPEVRPGPGRPAPPAGQELYGFWEEGPPPPRPGATGRWMSGRAAVLLGGRPDGGEVMIEVVPPPPTAAPERGPSVLRVTLGAPPDRCAAAVHEFSVAPGQGVAARVLRAPVPSDLRGSGVLEVSLAADRAVPAFLLGEEARDARLVSFFVSRIALE